MNPTTANILITAVCVLIGLSPIPLAWHELCRADRDTWEEIETPHWDHVPEVPGTWEPEKAVTTIRHNAEHETVTFLAQIPGKNGQKIWEYSADEIARFVHVRRGDALLLIRLARRQEES